MTHHEHTSFNLHLSHKEFILLFSLLHELDLKMDRAQEDPELYHSRIECTFSVDDGTYRSFRSVVQQMRDLNLATARESLDREAYL